MTTGAAADAQARAGDQAEPLSASMTTSRRLEAVRAVVGALVLAALVLVLSTVVHAPVAGRPLAPAKVNLMPRPSPQSPPRPPHAQPRPPAQAASRIAADFAAATRLGLTWRSYLVDRPTFH
jgi:hypothetical protein